MRAAASRTDRRATSRSSRTAPRRGRGPAHGTVGVLVVLQPEQRVGRDNDVRSGRQLSDRVVATATGFGDDPDVEVGREPLALRPPVVDDAGRRDDEERRGLAAGPSRGTSTRSPAGSCRGPSRRRARRRDRKLCRKASQAKPDGLVRPKHGSQPGRHGGSSISVDLAERAHRRLPLGRLPADDTELLELVPQISLEAADPRRSAGCGR